MLLLGVYFRGRCGFEVTEKLVKHSGTDILSENRSDARSPSTNYTSRKLFTNNFGSEIPLSVAVHPSAKGKLSDRSTISASVAHLFRCRDGI